MAEYYPGIEDLDIESITDEDGYNYYVERAARVKEEYSSNPLRFFNDITLVIDKYGWVAADDAMQNLTGEGATDIVKSNNERYSWQDTKDIFEECVEHTIGYMSNTYSPAECREELVDGELWFYSQAPQKTREAMNEIIALWTGTHGFLDFVEEIIGD